MSTELKNRFQAGVTFRYPVASLEECTRLLANFDGHMGLEADTIRRQKDDIFMSSKKSVEERAGKALATSTDAFWISSRGLRLAEFRRFRNNALKLYFKFNKNLNLKSIQYLDNTCNLYVPSDRVDSETLKRFFNQSILEKVSIRPFSKFTGYEFQIEDTKGIHKFRLEVEIAEDHSTITIGLPIFEPLQAGFNKANIANFPKRTDPLFRHIITGLFPERIISFKDI